MDRPVIVCGLGRVGRAVLGYLRATEIPIVVIDQHAKADDPALQQVRVINGDCRDASLLKQAGVADCRGVLILTSNDLVNFSTTLIVRQLAPEVRIVLRLFNQNILSRLGQTIRNVVPLSVSGLSAPLIALSVSANDVDGTFSLRGDRFQIIDYTITPQSSWFGQHIWQVNQLGQFLMIGLQQPGHPPTILRDISSDHLLQEGDQLTLAARIDDLAKLQDRLGTTNDDVRWAGRIRRFGRLAYRTFTEMDLAVRICSILLAVVVFISTSIYHWGLGLKWADGLYRTISVIGTGGELGGNDYEGWAKVFVSGLRIFGTLLVAAFTAILTNFLIRARYGGVFEVRRIPDANHVVVIGLGNVGFRTVEELVKLGEQVVVIDLKTDDALVNRCRRMGVPVIVGDGTSPLVLRQAHVKEARAVICVTNDDLLNLEIALLANEANTNKRVVVRLSDTSLAETTRTVAAVKLALSLPDLAAPAFVAGLLGDEVHCMFQIGGRMMSVVQLRINETHHPHLLNRSLKAISIDYGFLPIAVLDADGQPKENQSARQPIQVNDQLLVIIPLDHLDELTGASKLATPYSVAVDSFTIAARDDVRARVMAFANVDADTAEEMLNHPPIVIANDLSDGGAEELIDELFRNRILAHRIG